MFSSVGKRYIIKNNYSVLYCMYFFAESLDELEEMVVELFSTVENKDVEAPIWKTHPFKENQFKTMVYVSPVKDVRNLNIVFPCEDLTEFYKSAVSTLM